MDNLELNNSNQSFDTGEAKKMNSLQRIIGIIFSPSEVMKNLDEKPRILFPILAMILGMPILYLLRLPLFQDTVRKSIEISVAKQGNAQEVLEQMDTMVKVGTIGGLISTPISVLVMWLVMTAILFAFVKIFKGEGSFKQYCSVTGYAYVITLLSFIVTFAASFLTNSIMLDSSLIIMKDFMATDAMSTFMKGFLFTILKSFDVFGIWYYIVIAIGVAGVSKLSKKKVYQIVVILFIIFTLFGAVVAGVTGSGNLM